MSHYLLLYEVGQDFLQRRAVCQDTHLQHALESSARREIILADALTDPPDQAVLLLRADSQLLVEKFARAYRQVVNGLVRKWQIKE